MRYLETCLLLTFQRIKDTDVIVMVILWNIIAVRCYFKNTMEFISHSYLYVSFVSASYFLSMFHNLLLDYEIIAW